MDFSKISDAEWKYPAIPPFAEGMLRVGEGHELYWAEFGNPAGEPVIFIHGGPGGGCEPDYARFFNPARYRVLLFDQRGCGKSRPHIAQDAAGGMAGNITAALVRDIAALREARGITGKAIIFGGSWGSTLALAYAQAHPARVSRLVLRGIFLCDSTDLAFFYQGNAAQPDDRTIPGAYRAYESDGDYTVPPHLRDARMRAAYAIAWSEYVGLIPQEERGDMIAAYHRRLNGQGVTPEERLKAAVAWSAWEGVTSYLNHDVSDLGTFAEPHFAIAFATIENEYFYRALRGRDEALAALMRPESIARIAPVPTHIVHGAHDQVCIPLSARTLRDALLKAGAKELDYREVTAGHSMKDREINRALTGIMDGLE